MSPTEALQKLLHDQQLVAIFVLVAVDLVLGLAASVKAALSGGEDGFHFTRLMDFLRDDVLGKVLPWASIYIFAQMYTGLSVLGINLGDIATGIWVGMLAALVASLGTSLSDLGVPITSLPVVGGTLGRAPKKTTA